MTPLVSIITPIYNSENFLEETVVSILNQSYSNWELLLIDDCSTDNTLALANKYSNKFSNIIVLKNQTNSGAAVSRNKGITAASGDFIAFLDADDLFLPNALQ